MQDEELNQLLEDALQRVSNEHPYHQKLRELALIDAYRRLGSGIFRFVGLTSLLATAWGVGSWLVSFVVCFVLNHSFVNAPNLHVYLPIAVALFLFAVHFLFLDLDFEDLAENHLRRYAPLDLRAYRGVQALINAEDVALDFFEDGPLVARWLETEVRAILAVATLPEIATQRRQKWIAMAYPDQIPPRELPWSVFLMQGEPGIGKSRACAEDIWWQAASQPNTYWAVVVPALCDLGPNFINALIELVPQELLFGGNSLRGLDRSRCRIRFANGSYIDGYSATTWHTGDSLRGSQYHGAWVDQMSAFGEDAPGVWEALSRSVRLGYSPRILVSTRPNPQMPLLYRLVGDEDTYLVDQSGNNVQRAA